MPFIINIPAPPLTPSQETHAALLAIGANPSTAQLAAVLSASFSAQSTGIPIAAGIVTGTGNSFTAPGSESIAQGSVSNLVNLHSSDIVSIAKGQVVGDLGSVVMTSKTLKTGQSFFTCAVALTLDYRTSGENHGPRGSKNGYSTATKLSVILENITLGTVVYKYDINNISKKSRGDDDEHSVENSQYNISFAYRVPVTEQGNIYKVRITGSNRTRILGTGALAAFDTRIKTRDIHIVELSR